ncbi:MAG: hypothetical protein DWG76_07420 [Chloroflexi bacterium]|nr:hypothetical protein [Chloroflexota bacterium]
MRAQRKRNLSLLLAVGALGLAALACARAGEILPDDIATEQAIPTATPVRDLSAQAEYQIGEQAQIFGGSFGALVPLYGQPGSRSFTSQIQNNSIVIIIELGLDEDGNVWYEVDGQAGQGWLRGANLQPVQIDLSVQVEEPTATPAE